MSFKDFVDGVEFTAAEVDEYLMRQVVFRFATTAEMTGALSTGIKEPGMLAYCQDTRTLYQLDAIASTWLPIQSEWQTWTTSWTAATTAPVIGNGVYTGVWRVSGGDVEGHAKLILGTSTGAGSGSYAWTLPTATEGNMATHTAVGQAVFYDASAAAQHPRQLTTIASTVVVAISDASTRASHATPFGYASTDQWSLHVRYRPGGLSVAA